MAKHTATSTPQEEQVCKNCGHQFTGHYCNHCGQHAQADRLGHMSVWDDIRYGVFHYNGKIGYTTRQLITRPGHTAKEYIEGKRVKHFKPLSYVIILAGIYVLLHHLFHIDFLKVESDTEAFVERINTFVDEHYSWVTLLSIPIYALGTYLAFRKQGYNFMEHVVINAFLAGMRLLFRIITFPLIYLFHHKSGEGVVGSIISLGEFVLMIWALWQIFGSLKFWKFVWRVVIFYAIYWILVLLISFGILAGAYVATYGFN